MNARTLAMIRAKALSFLTARCNIYALSDARGVAGAPLDLRELSASCVPCRLISSGDGGDVGEFADKTVMDEMYTITLPTDTDLNVYDEIVMRASGKRYQVTSIRDGLTDSAYFDAEVKRMRD